MIISLQTENELDHLFQEVNKTFEGVSIINTLSTLIMESNNNITIIADSLTEVYDYPVTNFFGCLSMEELSVENAGDDVTISILKTAIKSIYMFIKEIFMKIVKYIKNLFNFSKRRQKNIEEKMKLIVVSENISLNEDISNQIIDMINKVNYDRVYYFNTAMVSLIDRAPNGVDINTFKSYVNTNWPKDDLGIKYDDTSGRIDTTGRDKDLTPSKKTIRDHGYEYKHIVTMYENSKVVMNMIEAKNKQIKDLEKQLKKLDKQYQKAMKADKAEEVKYFNEELKSRAALLSIVKFALVSLNNLHQMQTEMITKFEKKMNPDK